LPALLDRLRQRGFPNYYGPQRFGRDGETLQRGLELLRQTPNVRRMSPFLRKLALSAAQSALFNHYLALRLADGLLGRVLLGDVMAKRPFGGMFVAEEIEREQARFEAGETVHAGPIFGRKTFAAAGEAAEREAAALADAGLTLAAFRGFGKLLQGTRRHNLVYPEALNASLDGAGVKLSFSLPAGSYATVLLCELMKTDIAPSEAET
jgi:tRNA pseudouridine13 synthase